MNSLGMLIDLSHISEKGFWDVMELSQKACYRVSSYSNAEKYASISETLRDEQIMAIKNNGGVIGNKRYVLNL